MGCNGSKAAGGEDPQEKATAAKADEKLLDKYTLGKPLGQGAFGIVYLCKNKQSKIDFAVKMVDQVETAISEIKQEVQMLQELKHPCIVELHDVYYEKVFVCMVLELCKGGDLIEGMQLHWKNRGMMTISTVQNISKMMVQSVQWIHSKSVIHRDLKGDNFLMDRKQIEHPSCRIYLSDFGTVVRVEPGQRLKQKCGTKTYWAPEFYNLNYTLPVDMWAIGVIMMGLVTGRFPFKGEDDCKKKPVKCPQAKEGEGFIIQTLERDEGKRLTADSALKHQFLASIKSAAQMAEEKSEGVDPNFKPEVKEGGANAGIQERRRELVDRMDNLAAGKGGGAQASVRTKDVSVAFIVDDKSNDKKVFYEWMPVSKIPGDAYIDKAKAKKITDVDKMNMAENTEGGITSMLKAHSIDTSKFGTGTAKSLDQFVEEVRTGQSLMMLDAAKKKNLVRVVEVVLLRIYHGSGANKKYLIKTEECLPDGRSRGEVSQLCGTKKSPHESARQTVARLVKDRLNMEDAKVNFDWEKTEWFEDEEMSPSYPGVRTVYKKEIYEGVLTTSDAAVLARVGLQGKANEQKFVHTCSKNYKRSFSWFSESSCKQKKVVMRAPASGRDISALVQAPVGFSEEELQKFLQSNKVEVKEEALKEFSDELVTGKSQLVRQDGKIVRLVEVVIVELRRTDGQVLIQAKEESNNVTKANIRLPAVKRRPDENVFWAAKRVLGKVLKISENLVILDKEGVMMEEKPPEMSKAFNMPTVYRRLVIPGTLQDAN